MLPTLMTILLLSPLTLISVNPMPVGVIRNSSLEIAGANTTTISGTCEECVCKLLTDPTFFSFNCFPSNITCHFHSVQNQNQPFSLITANNASFYFASLPTFVITPVSDTCIHANTSASILGSSMEPGGYLWTFDATLQDTSATFNGTPINNATYSVETITGYGSSLSLNSSMAQSVSIGQPFLPLFSRSWTFEAWIYLSDIVGGFYYPILGQLESWASDKYLHLVVQNGKLVLAFYNDDLYGVTDLISSRWYHAAFVFDSTSNNQSIYLDGMIESSQHISSPYQGVGGTLDIGVNYWWNGPIYFDGLIDQLSYTNRSKSSSEILRDATLTLYVSFNGNSTFDDGPLSINGSIAGSTSFVSGRQGQALQITNVSDSYFAVQGLGLLGRTNQSYSFSIWIKPATIHKSTVIHMSSLQNGTGWRLPIIGLSNTYQLISTSYDGVGVQVTGPVVSVNTWTHVVSTYSQTNGLRLYANGSLYNSSSPFSFHGSGAPNYLFVGSSRAAVAAAWEVDVIGQFVGVVDELRVYSRELTGCEINALANPGP